jgi:alpha-D-ribose 1-methylphosphonate 5-triphosphate diphosphatase
MDHTPGQRQFTSLQAWKNFYIRKSPYTEAELDRFILQRQEWQAQNGERHRRELVALAVSHGVALASHDDTDGDHVAESIRDGVAIAEFPTTVAAAEASRAAGIQVMMGAPNIIRGGSHSGNVAAEDLARAGLLDILSSDYVPASLLMAGFDLPRRVPGLSLPDAIRTVTLNPRDAMGLSDRGALLPGRRADLVRVAWLDDAPFAREVYRGGARVS